MLILGSNKKSTKQGFQVPAVCFDVYRHRNIKSSLDIGFSSNSITPCVNHQFATACERGRELGIFRALRFHDNSSNMPHMSDIENGIRWRLRQFSLLSGYPVHNLKYLRKIGPPIRPMPIPLRGSEIFAHRLPADALEDELFWFFQRAGDIYEIRLMLRPSGVANRGFAFVRYVNPEQAQIAIAMLCNEDFRPNYKICLESSVENNRLFLSGVPLDKTKDEIWQELLRAGVRGIVDVITYKGYRKNHANRGFVFVEFINHEGAACAKREFCYVIRLWNRTMILDWAEPIREVNAAVMAKVTRVFLRNLDVHLKKENLIETLKNVLDFHTVEKVYKHMDYSFIHFFSREMAERGLEKLQEYFCNTDIEVTWSKPPGVAKNRAVPPRLQEKTNRTKFHKHKNTEADGQRENKQYLQALKPGSSSQDHQCEEVGEYMKNSLCLDENGSYTTKANNNNIKSWELWNEGFDWFDRSVGKPNNGEKRDTLKESSKQRYQGGAQATDLRPTTYSVDEKRYTDWMHDAGSPLFREGPNQTLNLRFQLDLYENRGSKYTAS